MVTSRAGFVFPSAWRAVLMLLGILVVAVPLALFGSVQIMLIALLGVGIAAIMLARPEFTTVIVIFVFYTNMSVVAIRFGVPDVLAAAFFLLLGVPLMYAIFIQKQPLIINGVLLLMIIYLGVTLLSAITSMQPSATFSRINNFLLEGLLLYVLILNCVRTTDILKRSLWAIIIAGAFLGALSVYQSVSGDYTNDFGGLAQASNAAINAGEETFLGDQRTLIRLAGPVGEKNRYAQVMVVLIPLALARVLAEPSLKRKAFAAVCMLVIAAGALLTFSRGAGVTLAVIFVVIPILRVIPFRTWLIATGVLVLILPVVAGDYLGRISTLSGVSELASGNVEEADGSILGRATENLAAIMVFLDHPLLGVGPGQTFRYIREAGNKLNLRHLTENRRGHNMYLEELSDVGILGFSAFMGILGITLYRLYQLQEYWRKRNYDYFQTLAGLILAVLAYMTTAIFLHLSYARYYWFLLALAGSAIYVLSKAMTRSDELEIQR